MATPDNKELHDKLKAAGANGATSFESAEAFIEANIADPTKSATPEAISLVKSALAIVRPQLALRAVSTISSAPRAAAGLKQAVTDFQYMDLVNEWLDAEFKDQDAINKIYDEVRYDGFDSSTTIKLLFGTFTPLGVIKVAMLIALRGTKPENIGEVRIDGKSINSMLGREIKQQAVKKDDLTLQRIASVSPHIAANGLMIVNRTRLIPKRFQALPIPGYLQFPTAIALPWTRAWIPAVKIMAIEFSRAFGGNINLQLIDQIVSNQVVIPPGANWDALRNLKYFLPSQQPDQDEQRMIQMCTQVLIELESGAGVGSILNVLYIQDKVERTKAIEAMVAKK